MLLAVWSQHSNKSLKIRPERKDGHPSSLAAAAVAGIALCDHLRSWAVVCGEFSKIIWCGGQSGLAHNHAAQALVAGVEDEVRKRVREALFGKGPQAFIECFVDGADRARRKLWPQSTSGRPSFSSD